MSGGRRMLVACAVAFALLVTSRGASAHTEVGSTWFGDGTLARSGPSRTVISAYATGAQPETQFELVVGTFQFGQPGHRCLFDRTLVNPAVRKSSPGGFIGMTTGVVTMPPGDWQVCFLALGTITAPLPFTVV